MNHPIRYFRVLFAAPVLLAVLSGANRVAVAQIPMPSGGASPHLAQFQPSGQGFSSQPYGVRAAAATSPNSVAEQRDPGGSMIPDAAEAGTPEKEESGGTTTSVIDRLLQGGVLMIPLAVCSLVVFALAVERSVALRRGRIIPRPFVRRFTECVQDGQLSYDEALEICDEFDCPVAEVFHATVKRWGRPTVEVEQAVMDAGERVADGLRRYLRLFHAVSNVAPLLGLLGTVLGMIEAFESLSSAGSNSAADMLASGISQALITTAAGLSVAIPAYLAYIYFSARADRYLVEIDSLCQRVVDSISAEGLQTGASKGIGKRTKRAA